MAYKKIRPLDDYEDLNGVGHFLNKCGVRLSVSIQPHCFELV